MLQVCNIFTKFVLWNCIFFRQKRLPNDRGRTLQCLATVVFSYTRLCYCYDKLRLFRQSGGGWYDCHISKLCCVFLIDITLKLLYNYRYVKRYTDKTKEVGDMIWVITAA